MLLGTAVIVSACGASNHVNRGPFDAQTVFSTSRGQIQLHKFIYTTFDGSRVPALFAVPRATASRGCLIWENGLGTNKEESEPIWYGAARLGLATFAIDLRDHGERAASTAQLPRAVRNPVLLRALVTGTVADLKRAVDYLETQRVCRHNIAYAGISLGAMIGSVLTAQDKRIRAVILMSVPPSWRALISSAPTIILPGIEQHPEQLKQAVDLLSPLNPDRWIGQISPRPLLLMIGRQDPIVPAAAARQIEGAARTPKTVVNYQGSHNPLGPTDASPNAQDIANFLLRHIVEPSYPGS